MSIWKLSTGEIVKNASGKVVSCADCPCDASECCDVQPTTWTVDFGAGGLIDSECDYCDQIAGEFVLTATDCTGIYTDDVCVVPPNSGGDTDVGIRITITVSTTSIAVKVELYFPTSTTSSGASYSADYSYVAGAGETIDCIATEYTLNKFAEINSLYTTGKRYCTGNLPATITVTGA